MLRNHVGSARPATYNFNDTHTSFFLGKLNCICKQNYKNIKMQKHFHNTNSEFEYELIRKAFNFNFTQTMLTPQILQIVTEQYKCIGKQT